MCFKKIVFLFTLIFFNITKGFPQNIIETVDEVTFDWDQKAEILSTYPGLIEFCKNPSFRESSISTLNKIHHYDTLIYNKITQSRTSKQKHKREVNKTINDILDFENEYTTYNFIKFLQSDCKASKYLESHKTDYDGFGVDSYDGKLLVLEVELQRFVHQITRRVDKIRVHVHKLYE